jgi:plasmid stabilization system protein ParE
MNYQVVITVKAYDDADVMARWIKQYSAEKAEDWYFDFLEAAESLQIFPARCGLAAETTPEIEVRQLLFNGYRLLFTITETKVLVVHVRHQKQRRLSPDELVIPNL